VIFCLQFEEKHMVDLRTRVPVPESMLANAEIVLLDENQIHVMKPTVSVQLEFSHALWQGNGQRQVGA